MLNELSGTVFAVFYSADKHNVFMSFLGFLLLLFVGS